MKITTWRIVKAEQMDSAFNGEGHALLVAGRIESESLRRLFSIPG